MRPTQATETFPDGVVDVYPEAGNRRLGDKKATLRYEQQSVGINRYYQAQALASNRIDRVIKVPHTGLVDRMDIAVMRTEDGRQYRIMRIQNKPERGVDLWELQSVQVAIKVPEPEPEPTPEPSGDEGNQEE